LKGQFSIKDYDIKVWQGLERLILIYKMSQTKLNLKKPLSPPLAQNPIFETYLKAQMSFRTWNLPTMSLREEPTLRVLSLDFVDKVFEPYFPTPFYPL
jgi:hypothetical protein